MNMKQVWAVAILAGSISITDSTVFAQQPATAETIAAPITTSFGVYAPYTLPTFHAELGRKEASITGEFTNVQKPDHLEWSQHFTQAERAMLRRNNLLVRPEAMGTFAEAYNGGDLPPFITTDAALHGLRITMMEAERRIQRDHLMPALRDMMERISANITGQLDRTNGTPAYEANRRLLAWAQTTRRLLDPTFTPDPRVATLVKDQVEQIERGTNTLASPIIIGSRINPATFALASQKGFDEKSARFYRALAWLNSVGFTIGSNADPTTVRMAIILARIMETMDGSDLASNFNDLSDLLAFFHGRTDQDVSPAMIGGALRGFYGTYGFASAGTGSNAEIQQFAEYFAEQAPAEIQSRNYQFYFLPRPASVSRDLMTQGKIGAFGIAMIGALSGENNDFGGIFLRRPAEHWVQDIDWITLYTLQSYGNGEVSDEGFPRFMRSDAYRARLNLGVLGAWADFHHASSTLPTQSTMVSRQTATSYTTVAGEAEGYVELQPRTWGRIAAMAQYLRSGLADGRFGDLIGQNLVNKLRDIENSSAGLMKIASLTLANQPLTSAQEALIAAMPKKIAAYETFSDPTLRPEGMMIAAGVVSNGKNLQVANGHPLAIYVIVPSNDDSEHPLTLARGAIFSYYETTTPAEEWIETIVGGQHGPQTPTWASGLVAPNVNTAQDAATFRTVNAVLSNVTAAYEPSLSERRSAVPTAQIALESNVVRRGIGELWFTIQAPRMNGAEVSVAVVDVNGRVIYRSSPVNIDNGERFDMIPLDNINNGNYFIRVIDTDSRTIASGRFMVTR